MKADFNIGIALTMDSIYDGLTIENKTKYMKQFF